MSCFRTTTGKDDGTECFIDWKLLCKCRITANSSAQLRHHIDLSNIGGFDGYYIKSLYHITVAEISLIIKAFIEMSVVFDRFYLNALCDQ